MNAVIRKSNRKVQVSNSKNAVFKVEWRLGNKRWPMGPAIHYNTIIVRDLYLNKRCFFSRQCLKNKLEGGGNIFVCITDLNNLDFILTAISFLLHAAFATNSIFGCVQVYRGKLVHAIVQVKHYTGTYTEVEDSNYGSNKLFHSANLMVITNYAVTRMAAFVKSKVKYMGWVIIKTALLGRPGGMTHSLFYIKPACNNYSRLHLRVRDCSGYPGEAIAARPCAGV